MTIDLENGAAKFIDAGLAERIIADAFYQNRKITVCRVQKSPLRIAGTPFTGDESCLSG